MAVTLTVDELGDALRLPTPLPASQAGVVGRLLGVGTAIVAEYLEGTTYENLTDVENEAAIRIAGFLLRNDPARNRRFSDTLADSGALSILSPFRVQRALAIDGTAAEQHRIAPQEEAMVQTPPRGVKLYTIDFANPGVLYNDLAAMTGAELVAAGTEVTANVIKRVSWAGPVQCWRQVFEYTRTVDFQWLVVAIPNDAIPSHYQVRKSSPLYPFNEGVWPSGTIQLVAPGLKAAELFPLAASLTPPISGRR